MKDIKIRSSENIDRQKWNVCIAKSANSSLFAHTGCLDYMTAHWDGLVINDYDAVMPLPWNKKYGIKYLCAVPFVRQLGLIGDFSANTGIPEIILERYKYGDIQFNFMNENIAGKPMIVRSNFVLDLHRDYENIYAAYKRSLKHKLKRTTQLSFCDAAFDEVIAAYQRMLAAKNIVISSAFDRVKNLCHSDFGKKYFHAYKVIDEKSDTVLLGIYAKDDRRVYNFMATNTNSGREKFAMLFSTDYLIRMYAEKPLLFDFMGSDIPGVKAFTQNFAPMDQPYFMLHFNRLPWPWRILKK